MKPQTDIKPPPKKRGRKPLYATEEERAKAKRKRSSAYFASEEYKQKRREKYRLDKSYRQECIDRAKAYAAQNKQGDVDAYTRLIRKNVFSIDNFAQWRNVTNRFHKRSRPRQMATLTIHEFSQLIARDPSLVRDWVRTGRLPAPTWLDQDNRANKVYSAAQAIAMAELIALHLKTDKAHFLETSKSIIKQLAKTSTLK
jgi:hypothetical protein